MTVSVGDGVSATLVQPSVFRGSVAPSSGVRVGDLWMDTSVSPPVFKQCDSISPITWVAIAAGGAGDGYNLLVVNGGAASLSTTLTLSNSNNVSFGVAGGVITATATFAGGAGGGIAIAAGTQTATTNTVVLQNSNGISFGMSGSSQITASYTVPSTAGLISNVNVSAGTTSQNLSALTLSNANNVSFGLNGSTITASASYSQSTSPSAIVGSNATYTSGSVTFAGSGAVTVRSTTGQQIVIDAPAQTVQTQNLVSVQGSTGNISFSNSNGITFGFNASTVTASHNGLTSQSNQAFSAAGGSSAFQTLNFANSNGVTFSNSNGSVVASHNGLTTARASNDGVGLNTALTAGPLAWTVNSNGISLNASSAAGTTSGFAGNLISGSMTHNTAGLNLSLNHPAWLTTAALSNHSHGNPTLNLTNLSGTTASNSAGFTLSLSAAAGGVTPVASASNGSFSFTTLAFSNANNVTFGTSAGSIITASVAAPGAAAENNWFNLLGANTAGNTTASGSTIGLSGLGVTLSGTNASQIVVSAPPVSSLVGVGGISLSTNGSTISISYTGGNTLRSFYPYNPASTVSQTNGSIGRSTASIWAFPFVVPENLQFNAVRLHASASVVTATGLMSQTLVHQYGIYSKNGNSLSRISSSSYGISVSQNSISGSVSLPTSTATTGYGLGGVSWSSTATAQSLFGTVGQRALDLQFGNTMSLAAGVYWLVFLQRQTTAGSAIGLSTAMVANAMFPFNNLGPLGQSTAAGTTDSAQGFRPFGVFTSTGSAGHSGTALIDALADNGFANTISNIPVFGFIST